MFDFTYQQLNEFEDAKQALDKGKSCQITGCSDSQLAHFISGLSDGPLQRVIVTYGATKAKELYEDLKGFGENVVLYPSKDFIFFSADVHGNLILKQRLEFIQKVVQGEAFTVVLTADAFMDQILPLKRIKENFIQISKGDEIEIDALKKKLSQMGYENVDQVDAPGQFAVRGSIVDIYTLTDDVPYRIDFWDNEVDVIKSFDATSQRSIEVVNSIKIFGANEYPITDDEVVAGVKKIKEELDATYKKLRDEMKTEEAYRLKTSVEEFLTQVDINKNFATYDSYVNYFFDETVSLMDYFDDAMFFIDEPRRVIEYMSAVSKEFTESMHNRMEKGYVLEGQTTIMQDPDEIIARINKQTKAVFTTIAQKVPEFEVKEFVEVDAKNIPPYNGKFQMLVEDLQKYKNDKYAVVLVTQSATRGRRMVHDLLEHDINVFFDESSAKKGEEESRTPHPGEVMIMKGRLRKGFTYPQIKFVAISDTDIFGEKRKTRKRKQTYAGSTISSFAELNAGDYVVHENYGVGIYRGIEKKEVDKVTKDYIKIEYQKNAFLYILATQLDRIQKYANSGAKIPKINKLGGSDWKRTKARVEKAVDEIADELVELYAEREHGNGFQFSADDAWQKEFEELFTHEETEDQLEAIREVKRDMESTKIMDRLICGDVGFGKTEVAIRAAFKAVKDGKQVAYLVPTTVLAQQHYKTFTNRFKNFPVRVEMLSRFRTKANINQTIKDLKNGTVDIVIGTHRLLSKDVEFKDLGLLIIDEEQRFGVKHKEKIKMLKQSVDVITLTATPIPRTLHMSLIGVRDMCVMEEAPQERMPIQTFVMEYNEEIARDAINRELARGGQVYYVYNRVQNIAEVAAKVQESVPDARVAYAHGQMGERQLEEIMYDFVNGDIDVLVTTTIIETGLDIRNANTMIIYNAEKMGLSQLYQLRGRVGRSNRVAYAFMMYNRSKMLSEVAEKRLTAIRDFTDLGSGVKIAMRDLEIRGAGNLLGASQSGHMGEVGYDLYCKMLEEAINRKKGIVKEKDYETKIDVDVDAFVPPTYIGNVSMKMDVYKRIANMKTIEDYEDMTDELVDRFGEIPQQVENLMQLVLIKAKAHDNYVVEIRGNSDQIELKMWPEAKIDVERIPILVREYKGKLRFFHQDGSFIYYPEDGMGVIENLKKLIEDLSTLRDNDEVI